jgi:hypothetical protein
MGFLQRLADWFGAPEKPCTTCGQPTRDVLVRAGREWVYYCRVHLLEEFARGFEKSSCRMAVYEFQNAGIVYGYYPVSTLKEFCWSPEDADILQRVLREIDVSQSCQSCGGNPWQVAYFDRATAPWLGAVPDIGTDRALRLCTRCAALQMVPVLRENPNEYTEGLYLPYQEDGMYITTDM